MKKVVLISSVLLTFVIGIYFYYYSDCQKYVLESESGSNQKIVSSNSLTMMYETEYQSGEYQVSSDSVWPGSGYIFNENLSKCENGGILTRNDENKKVLLQTNTSDKCFVYFDKEQDIIYLADYIINNVYTGTDGDNDLYYHDGVGTYTNADQEAGDYSYRYSGSNSNNYVCFGSDAEICPEDNLYRIIGVFGDEVKLIKADYVQTNLLGTNGDYYSSSYSGEWGSSSYYKGSLSQSSVPIYYWNVNGTNTWSESNLNTVNLNTNYLNNIGSTWSSKIANHTWQVGGATSTNVYNSPVKTAHTYEVGASAANTTYQAKIGLMYVSDYGYAASPENWSTNMGTLNTATNRDNNWMFMGLSEWTISRDLTIPEEYAFIVKGTGNVHYDNVGNVYAYIGFWAVRPSFYLESSVELSGGSGTSADPYRIA